MIADFWRVCPARPAGTAPSDRSRSMSANDRPAPKAPIFRKLRRLTPSQKPCLFPQNVNMMHPPSGTRFGQLVRSYRELSHHAIDKCEKPEKIRKAYAKLTRAGKLERDYRG